MEARAREMVQGQPGPQYTQWCHVQGKAASHEGLEQEEAPTSQLDSTRTEPQEQVAGPGQVILTSCPSQEEPSTWELQAVAGVGWEGPHAHGYTSPHQSFLLSWDGGRREQVLTEF